MPLEMVFRYRVYDMEIDDYRYSTRYATTRRISKIGGEPVYPSIHIDEKYLTDGWTKKDFDPAKPA